MDPNMDAWLDRAFEAATRHIPDSDAWMAYAGVGLLALFGIVLMVRGAKLAPFMAACAFLGVGGLGGSFVAAWAHTPVWATIIITAAIGFGLGLVLFRFWLATLVAACFAGAALSLYSWKVISPEMVNYASRNLDDEGWVTLAGADEPFIAAPSTEEEFGQMWSYLTEQIPSFQASVWAIVISTGLAGLAVGLLLPRLSRALFASTAGLLCAGFASFTTLKAVWPEALGWLKTQWPWTWGVLIVIWALSLLFNFVSVRAKRPKKKAADDEVAQGEPATA